MGGATASSLKTSEKQTEFRTDLSFCLKVEVIKLVAKAVVRLLVRTRHLIFVEDEIAEREGSIGSGKAEGDQSPLDREAELVYRGRRSGRLLRGCVPGFTRRALCNIIGSSAGESLLFSGLSANPGYVQFFRRLYGSGEAGNKNSRTSLVLTLGDAAYHLRPILQLVLLKKKKPWAAWVLALLIDAASYLMLKRKVAQLKAELTESSLSSETVLKSEEAELARRRGTLALALLRSPVFEKAVPVEKIEEIWQKIPGLNMINVVQLLLLWRPYYFYSSGT